MTKTTKLPDNKEALTAALSIRDQVANDAALNALNNQSPEDRAEGAEAVEAITPNKVEQRVDALMQIATGVFFQPEQRVLADNGKAYPLTWDFEGRDYESTEQVVTVDRFEFIDKMFAKAQCSGLEMILRQQLESIEGQRKRITNEIRFGHNAGTDVSGKVDSMANFLEHMIDQASLIEIALKRAVEAYSVAFNEVYLTRDARERFVAAKKASLAGSPVEGRLAKLGVNIG